MRIARNQIEACSHCGDGPPRVDGHTCGTYAAIETRILLNRAETKALDGILWIREQWFEGVVYRIMRANCVLFGRHSKVCAGRSDHRPRPS